MKIFVVRGTTGEYSDRNEWTVKAFYEEQKAKDFVLSMSEKAREVFTKAKELEDSGEFLWYAEVTEKYFPEFLKLDSSFDMDYTGTNYYYDPCELE